MQINGFILFNFSFFLLFPFLLTQSVLSSLHSHYFDPLCRREENILFILFLNFTHNWCKNRWENFSSCSVLYLYFFCISCHLILIWRSIWTSDELLKRYSIQCANFLKKILLVSISALLILIISDKEKTKKSKEVVFSF